MSYNKFFAVDLGATSGRTILGTIDNGKLQLEEITRFPNAIIQVNGHFFWNIYALYEEILKGLKVIAHKGINIQSIGIDTWGVDFVFFGEDGDLLRVPYSYRDPHTVGSMEKYFKEVPKEKVYELTGIQFMNFNSLFQLYTLYNSKCSALKHAKKILFIPDALSYMLTKKDVMEYTITSTSQIQNPRTRALESSLLQPMGLTIDNFGSPIEPGETIAPITKEIQEITGLSSIPVVAVAGHDTASAVAAIPAKDKHFAYLSSGTWSLMGIEVDSPIINEESFKMNFTNEGGIEGTTRFLKNICGMWLLERCRKEWDENGQNYSYDELISGALTVPAFESIINPDATCFANPTSMIKAIKHYCESTDQKVPETYSEITRCIFQSLALRYKQVFEYIKGISPFSIDVLHIIGGGSRNKLLNQFTANALGITVEAGPTEATAIGNIMLQAKAAGVVKDITDMRKMIRQGIELLSFEPQDSAEWEKGYSLYLKVYKENI